MKCTYWNREKLNAISEFSKSLNKEYFDNNTTITCDDIPNVLNICGADVHVIPNVRQEGVLDIKSACSKSILKTLIKNNVQISDGFLLWYPNYCFSCVFEEYLTKATK